MKGIRTLFFETSALVKLFHKEDGTENIIRLLDHWENDLWISELAHLEFLSSVYRRYRNQELKKGQLETAIAGFEDEIQRFRVEPLSQPVFQKALEMMKELGPESRLRTLDALHLASFQLVSEPDWAFITADDVLFGIAKMAGFIVVNPLKVKGSIVDFFGRD